SLWTAVALALGSRAHSELHCFPSRRSSDLPTGSTLPSFELGEPAPPGPSPAPPAPPEPLALPRPAAPALAIELPEPPVAAAPTGDRKSTRLNSSHVKISYAVFCLKKKIDTE